MEISRLYGEYRNQAGASFSGTQCYNDFYSDYCDHTGYYEGDYPDGLKRP